MYDSKTLYYVENRDGDEEERKKSRKLKKKLENGGNVSGVQTLFNILLVLYY